MFEDLIRELGSLDGRSVSVQIPADSEGYFDRACPSDACLFVFKIHEDDWKNTVRDEEVFCPFCRHSAAADKWWTENQLEHAQQVALGEVQKSINSAMRTDANRWNRQQPRNSFIGITMQVDSKPKYVALPPAAAGPMQLKISCSECGCRYAVIGAAYFCPSCGHNSVEEDFVRSMQKLTAAMDAIPNIQSAISDADVAEDTTRLVIESTLQNAVTAFQRYAEALYSKCQSACTPRRNAFQNLSEGSSLWSKVFGTDYESHLSKTDLAELHLYFQQRHLLAHKDGIVDDGYVSKSGDSTYTIGQRIVVKQASVRNCLKQIERLAAGMECDSAPHK